MPTATPNGVRSESANQTCMVDQPCARMRVVSMIAAHVASAITPQTSDVRGPAAGRRTWPFCSRRAAAMAATGTATHATTHR